MELLDVVDENGMPTGEIIEREKAHEYGILHRTSHVWIIRKKQGRNQILLQKRSEEKDSYPGCYDISSAGHIPAGMDFIESALRELDEELGVSVCGDQLIYCGQRRFKFDDVFHGKTFHDNQISNVYMLFLDREESDFHLQKEEVAAVKWFDLEECLQKVKQNQIKHCIFLDELNMVFHTLKAELNANKTEEKWNRTEKAKKR